MFVAPPIGSPVTLSLEGGAELSLDFGSFTRSMAVSGRLTGTVDAVDATGTTQVTLTGVQLDLATTPVFIDDDCAGRVSPALTAAGSGSLAPDGPRTMTVAPDGTIELSAGMQVTMRAAQRNGDDGCDSPYIAMRPAASLVTVSAAGRLAAGHADLVSATPAAWDMKLCSEPAPADEPCGADRTVPVPVQVTARWPAELAVG